MAYMWLNFTSLLVNAHIDRSTQVTRTDILSMSFRIVLPQP
jgi:hypothetical protein